MGIQVTLVSYRPGASRPARNTYQLHHSVYRFDKDYTAGIGYGDSGPANIIDIGEAGRRAT